MNLHAREKWSAVACGMTMSQAYANALRGFTLFQRYFDNDSVTRGSHAMGMAHGHATTG